jgi:hypothetical protein
MVGGGMSIQMAINALGGDGTVIVTAAGPFNGLLTVTGGHVAIIASDGVEPVITNGGMVGNTLSVTGGGNAAYLEGVQLRGNDAATPLTVTDGALWLDRVQMLQNPDGGVGSDNGAVHIRNSIIGLNGGQGFSNTRGVFADAGSVRIEYSTIAANEGNTGAPSIECTGAAAVEVHNSIVVAQDLSSISCSGITVDHSAIDTMGLGGIGNVSLSAFDQDWFLNLGADDLHLGAQGSDFQDIALWEATDLSFDIDGDPRPAMVGAMDYAGADVP